VSATAVRDPGPLRDAMRLLPSGVVLVTVVHEGRPWGLTISSCSCLTMDPPQLIVSLRTDTITCRSILDGGSFGVAVLGADQVDLARIGAASGAPKFIDAWCDPASVDGGAPRVRGARYHLGCETVATHAHGDHTLVVGGPHRSHPGTPGVGDPLVYVDRAFRRVGAPLGTPSNL
jgi:flavin reductase (DIM6/NTAB) family NADH-FMN oxidoreductase RutF